MEQIGRRFGFALLLLTAVPAQAQVSPSAPPQQTKVFVTPRPLIDPATRCGVFAPPPVAMPYPHLKWNGACRDGLAEGRGTASFAATTSAAPQKIWHGNFRNGFFIGEANLTSVIVPVSPYAAGIELPQSAPQDGRIWLNGKIPSEGGPVPVCAAGTAEIGIEAPSDITVDDEARQRRMMQRAALAYREACGASPAMRIAIFAGGFQRQVFIARAGLAAGAAPGTLHSFQSLATVDRDRGNRTRLQEERQQDRAAESRRNWQDFTRANAVAVWVTPRQLDLSPAQYEGRIVAFPSRFMQKLGPDTALMHDPLWGRVMVSGLPHYVMQQGTAMIIAGRSLGRQKLPNAATDIELSSIAATALKLCQIPGCADFVEWMEVEKSFSWGADHSKFLN